jgi:27-O-demethylrifamycin SV methyltransferase
MTTADETKAHAAVNRPPDAQAVGDYYDHTISEVMSEIWDGNLHAGLWRDGNEEIDFTEAAEALTNEMIRRLDPRPGDRVLDVGCGNGTPAIQLAKAHDVEVVGISVSERQVARANERAQAAGVADRVSFELVNAMELPYADESFDRAWAVESMLHMPDKVRVMSQVARVLRPGGAFPIADMVYREPEDGGTDRRARYSTAYATLTPLKDYAGLIERAGLVAEDVSDVTRETSRTSAAFTAGLRSRREQLVAAVGTQGYELVVGNSEALGHLSGLGYVLITVRRP